MPWAGLGWRLGGLWSAWSVEGLGWAPDGRTVCQLPWASSQPHDGVFPLNNHLPPNPLGHLGATGHFPTDPVGIQARPAWGDSLQDAVINQIPLPCGHSPAASSGPRAPGHRGPGHVSRPGLGLPTSAPAQSISLPSPPWVPY